MKPIPLSTSFFDRNTVAVARDLLGKLIVCSKERKRRIVRIVETEAYLRGDPASHSYVGETKRNRSMFKGPGTLYVFTMHRQHCMNVVTRLGEAVLIRAGEPVENIEFPPKGPGLLCRALGIVRQEDDGKSLLNSDIMLADDGYAMPEITETTRIGISRAKDKLLRFYIRGNKFVSKP